MAKPEAGPMWPSHLLLLGCGNMAGAMLLRWLDEGLPAERVTVVRPSGNAVAPGVRVLTALEGPVEGDTLVMLGCKPQQLADVAGTTAPLLGPETTMLSILAGVPIARIRDAFPAIHSIVRCMPNLPVRVGKGVSILKVEDAADERARDLVDAMCSRLGLVEWLDDEQLFDAATALAGCGPAFVYRFIDALAAAGAELGLAPDAAARMALKTVEGAALSAAAADRPPADLADAVASKGGMTREGLDVLDRSDGLAPLVMETLKAARDRGAVLAALSTKAS
ncbi:MULTISPECIES: pyrroline-5-carboxylate reductase family protein [Sphingobium]|uniref:pyrroline-5-carboxylate reductase family protein n=1 Tax=Sphingobium TaxID=165695 RepID=UPI0015ECBCDB|nr:MULTISPECIES: pyrroline-5-carboxylate reductase dimerization domain-containing protein [Sphingobium]MCW2362242.1 pyrroline-5-carboxylate reductase [Sphingobium sp. B10D3B]MCW2401079.1 pyrroline-5-carboxylate reductase [Sphingobium sp. B10D7B]MCW2408059.1 pyrroline-5-carboxylate reductase [Sphingobium xanthum]